MKKILMIGTGGTIASEMTPEGLTPELNTHQLLAYLPRIAQLCHVDCIQLYSLDSTMLTAFVAGQHESCPVALAADREGHP